MTPPLGLTSVWGQSGQVSGWGHYLGQQPAGAESVSDRGEKYGLDVIIPSTDPISSQPWDRGRGYLAPWGVAAGGRSGW